MSAVTLNKSEKDYSPSTLYEDYAINERLFHWQSQSRTSVESETGQRYINHLKAENKIILFVREDKKQDGLAAPYISIYPRGFCRGSSDRGCYQQANGRLYRQGQKEHVIVNHIIAKGTIDEDVMRVLQKKEACQDDLLEAVRARRKRENSWRVPGMQV